MTDRRQVMTYLVKTTAENGKLKVDLQALEQVRARARPL